MRLQLTDAAHPGRVPRLAAVLVSLMTFLPGAPAGAAPIDASVDARSGVYQDTDHTTVSTSTVSARALVKGRLAIEARYLVDVVSSASVDVISAATSAFRETRHEAMGGLGYRDGSNAISASYIYSIENDWESHTANLSLSRDLLRHNLTLGLGGTFGANAIGRAGDSVFHRSLLTGGAIASATLSPTPRDLVSINYSVAHLNGYQASPYRYVYFGTGGAAAGQPETVPERRTRHAITALWNRHVFKSSAVRTHLRGYLDDWEVMSLTAGVEYLAGFGRLTFGPHLRGYFQQHAGFYQPSYPEHLTYMTADRELSTFLDGFVGVRLTYRRDHLGPVRELRLEIKADGFGFWFLDFPRLPYRLGIVAELGLGMSI